MRAARDIARKASASVAFAGSVIRCGLCRTCFRGSVRVGAGRQKVHVVVVAARWIATPIDWRHSHKGASLPQRPYASALQPLLDPRTSFALRWVFKGLVEGHTELLCVRDSR